MIAMKTILCPVDFSSATDRQVDVAVDLCRAFGARLVLHHNRHGFGSGASVGWMWNADHHDDTQASAESKLQTCLARVPAAVPAEGIVTQGPNAMSVLAVSDSVNADLVILTSHGTHSEQHASITEKALEHGQHAVLVLHEAAVESRTPRFASPTAERQVVIVPTDFSADSQAAMTVAFELAKALPIELHVLHVLPKTTRRGNEDETVGRIRALVPPELADQTQVHIDYGNPSEAITRLSDRLSAACIVMGEHTRGPVRRWFGRGISRLVMHQARCPVWYVPGAVVRTQVAAPPAFSIPRTS